VALHAAAAAAKGGVAMTEDKKGKKKDTRGQQRKRELSEAFNRVLGVEGVDFTPMKLEHMEVLARKLDHPADLLRHLARLEMRSRAKDRAGQIVDDLTGVVGEVIDKRPAGLLFREFFGGG
jgi:hypothetical protein